MIQTFKEKQKSCAKRVKVLKTNPTNAELALKAKLDQLHIKYIFQKGFIEGPNYVIVDFYIPKHKLCIEVDGGYHNTTKQKIRDANKTDYLRNYRKFRLLRISNDLAFTIGIKDLDKLLA